MHPIPALSIVNLVHLAAMHLQLEASHVIHVIQGGMENIIVSMNAGFANKASTTT